jgi:hypothetical protein
VAELPTPAPPIARTAPVALPPWIVAAALLVRLVIVPPGLFNTPPPPRVRPAFPTAAPPSIAPELVSAPIAPELPTPAPATPLVEAPADVAAELAAPPAIVPLLVSAATVPELRTPSPPNAAAELPLEIAAPPLMVPAFWSVFVILPALLTPTPPTAPRPVAPLCIAPPPLIVPLLVSVPSVPELRTPAPPSALVAPVALPPWIVAAALLLRLVIVAPGPFDTPSPLRVMPRFPVATPPLIAPELVSVPIAPELATPTPAPALVEAPANITAELAAPPVIVPAVGQRRDRAGAVNCVASERSGRASARGRRAPADCAAVLERHRGRAVIVNGRATDRDARCSALLRAAAADRAAVCQGPDRMRVHCPDAAKRTDGAGCHAALYGAGRIVDQTGDRRRRAIGDRHPAGRLRVSRPSASLDRPAVGQHMDHAGIGDALAAAGDARSAVAGAAAAEGAGVGQRLNSAGADYAGAAVPCRSASGDRPAICERRDRILVKDTIYRVVDRAGVVDRPRGASCRRRRESYSKIRGDASAVRDRDITAVALNN